MTLKKLFSHKDHHHSSNADNGSNSLKAYNRRHDSTKSSSVSLSRSISRLSQKERDRQLASNSKSKSLRYSSEKPLAQKLTVAEHPQQSQSTRPDITVEDKSAAPVGLTASEKFEIPDNNGQFGTSDIHNVVSSLRHSIAEDIDDGDNDGSDSFHSLDDVEERPEEDNLYAELVTVQNRLENVNAAQPVEMKKRLGDINSKLQAAVERGGQLENRTKSVMETAKQLISTLSEQNKVLSASNENIVNEIDRIKKENETAMAELQSEHETKLTELSTKHETEIRSLTQNLQSQLESGGSAYQELKTEQERLLEENLALKAAERALKTELDQLKEAHGAVVRDVRTTQEASLEELHSQHSSLLSSHQQLQDQYHSQLSAFNELREKHEQQSTALTDISNQYKEQLALYEALQKEHNTRLKDYGELQIKYDSIVAENQQLRVELEQQANTHRNLTHILQQSTEDAKTADSTDTELQGKLQQLMITLSTARADKRQLEQTLEHEQASHQKELDTLQTKFESEQRQQKEEFEKEKAAMSQEYANKEEKVLSNLRQENTNLSELVECLQAKIKELSMQNRNSVISLSRNSSTRSANRKEQDRQEELMKMHTRAQFSLIEYLEGEDDVLSAMSKFKKQLEAEMKELDSTDVHGNSSIGPSSLASTSQSMR